MDRRNLTKQIIRLTTSVVQALDIGPQQTLVGIIFFAGESHTRYEITLNEYTNKPDLERAINISLSDYPVKSGTHFIPVLKLLRNSAFNQSYGFRPDFPNVGIIMTDGRSSSGESDEKLSTEAQRFHNDCILDEFFAVGLSGETDPKQLGRITDNNSTVFRTEEITPATIARIQQDLIQQLCQETSKCK